MKKYTFFFFIIPIFFTQTVKSQNYFSEILLNKLNAYVNENYPEKVYIHTDKSIYTEDETIWFSVYLVNGITHQKTQKSNVVYAELLNAKGSLIDRKRLFVNDLSTSGDFKLPKKINSGNYKIRAYTNYMRNHSHDHFFEKEIKIWSYDEKKVIKNNIKNDSIFDINKTIKPDLNFYPQGGYLINDLVNKVAVKLKNEIYNTEKITATIVDENNTIVTSFTSKQFGLGEFIITPEKGKTYYAVINENDNLYKYKLPNALDKGFIINTSFYEKELIVELNSNTINGLLGSSIVFHERGKLVYNQTFKTTDSKKILKIALEKLNTGIHHITLFNSNSKPVSERLVFIENDAENTSILVKKENDYYKNRKKVTLKINVKNNTNVSLPSKLSMTVKDVNVTDNNDSERNIKTWLLLNSDLRGKIKNPNYFFQKDNRKKRQYLLDLLMLTHGWRRFTWQEMLQNNPEKLKYQPEKGIIISGKTLQTKSPYRIISVPTRLTFSGKTILQEPVIKSDLKGEYSFGPYVFYDSIPIFIEARLTSFNSKDDKDREVMITPIATNDIGTIYKDSTKINNQKSEEAIDSYFKIKNYLAELKAKFLQNDNVLDEVIINSTLDNARELREREMNDRTSYGGAFNRFDVSNKNPHIGTALELFYTVPNVNVVNNSLFVNRFEGVAPLILLNEIPINETDLTVIPASQISFIDVLTGPDAEIVFSSNVVISIYSKEGYNFSSSVKRKPGIINYKIPGFYLAKEFYSPDHINDIEAQTKADLRTTLYWNPNITVKDNTDVEISFFTSDISSKYIIEIQGITYTGIPLNTTTQIVVE